MASFRMLKHGNWQYRISHTVNGQRREKSKSGFKCKPDAARAAYEKEKELGIN
ncbi:Arm DNA-binding domain-containing protein [Shouchella lonarensis]|uniref:AP2-like DNA-binding integrase domain-containing protein n=1 Tax=Shouchella lonarensis TaxID=1464122 RepID=A0A1G6HRY7_9BACI|nr:Arm DNA-binding domain-containing protein [Shouchella lonarensis]SDB97067.1 AP2-like DNA-binding integrase domain-containing protein [Shouchella lonarensis]